MKNGLPISFCSISFVIAMAALLGGCSALPSMQHCHEVSYIRKGADIQIHAECRAPIGDSLRL